MLDGFSPDVLQTDIEDFASLDVPDQVERWPVIPRKGNPALDGDLPPAFLYEGSAKRQGPDRRLGSRGVGREARGNMILAGGLSAANVAEAIRTVRPRGVDVSSAVEDQPGQKDPTLIKQFVSAARAAETTE